MADMLWGEEELFLECPYCGESISILVDTTVRDQNFIEDCEVCCNPISVHVIIVEGDVVYLEVVPAY